MHARKITSRPKHPPGHCVQLYVAPVSALVCFISIAHTSCAPHHQHLSAKITTQSDITEPLATTPDRDLLRAQHSTYTQEQVARGFHLAATTEDVCLQARYVSSIPFHEQVGCGLEQPLSSLPPRPSGGGRPAGSYMMITMADATRQMAARSASSSTRSQPECRGYVMAWTRSMLTPPPSP